MPEIRYYRVTQERDIKVWAKDPIEAAEIASAAFRGEIQKGDIAETHITREIRVISLEAREENG